MQIVQSPLVYVSVLANCSGCGCPVVVHAPFIQFVVGRYLLLFIFEYKSTKRNIIVLVATSIGHLDLVAATQIDSLSILIRPLTVS